MNILIALLILLYIIPFGLITLNSVMECINASRNKTSVDGADIFVITLVSLVPIANIIVMLIFTFGEPDDVFILNYHKQINNTVKCKSCGIITRIHYLKDVTIRDMYYSKIASYKDQCPFCETKGSMYDDKINFEKNLPFGKKIGLITSVKHFFSQGLDLVERKLQKLHNKQKELEFIDSQLEIYTKLQEAKLNKYMEHAEKIKGELNLKE